MTGRSGLSELRLSLDRVFRPVPERNGHLPDAPPASNHIAHPVVLSQKPVFPHTQRRRVPEFMHWAISEFVPGCLNSHEGMQNQTAGSDYTSLGWKSLMTSWMFSSPLYKFMRGM